MEAVREGSPLDLSVFGGTVSLMSAVDDANRELLKSNIWEVVFNLEPVEGQAGRIKRLLYRARHADDAAGKGSG
jgi:hypothetical protein